MTDVDAVVVGAGPNGLAAAVTLARSGLSVEVFERNATIGGGARTSELTLPGFRHDVCSAVHPMALASRFFREFQLARRIELRLPPVSYGHPLQSQSSPASARRRISSMPVTTPFQSSRSISSTAGRPELVEHRQRAQGQRSGGWRG
uniref:phytoene desaturase family protein n=1 Tax=Agromyces humi TaxID=1766800 RepID=UPI0013582EB3